MTRILVAAILLSIVGCGDSRRAGPAAPTGAPGSAPEATWSVRGAVTDSLQPLPGAQVEIIGGVGAGRSTTVPVGYYQFDGLTGDVQLRASKPGFENQVLTVRGGSDRSRVDFALVPMNPANVAGAWRLTIQASPSCTSLLPSVQSRTYRAVVAQSGARATVTFLDDTVLRSTIEAVVREHAVSVLVGNQSHDSTDGFRERVAADTVLAILGTVPEAAISPSRISGVLQASIVTYEVPANASLEELLRPGRVSSSCWDDHRLTLER